MQYPTTIKEKREERRRQEREERREEERRRTIGGWAIREEIEEETKKIPLPFLMFQIPFLKR